VYGLHAIDLRIREMPKLFFHVFLKFVLENNGQLHFIASNAFSASTFVISAPQLGQKKNSSVLLSQQFHVFPHTEQVVSESARCVYPVSSSLFDSPVNNGSEHLGCFQAYASLPPAYAVCIRNFLQADNDGIAFCFRHCFPLPL
jgi:hypothetical protein